MDKDVQVPQLLNAEGEQISAKITSSSASNAASASTGRSTLNSQKAGQVVAIDSDSEDEMKKAIQASIAGTAKDDEEMFQQAIAASLLESNASASSAREKRSIDTDNSATAAPREGDSAAAKRFASGRPSNSQDEAQTEQETTNNESGDEEDAELQMALAMSMAN